MAPPASMLNSGRLNCHVDVPARTAEVANVVRRPDARRRARERRRVAVVLSFTSADRRRTPSRGQAHGHRSAAVSATALSSKEPSLPLSSGTPCGTPMSGWRTILPTEDARNRRQRTSSNSSPANAAGAASTPRGSPSRASSSRTSRPGGRAQHRARRRRPTPTRRARRRRRSGRPPSTRGRAPRCPMRRMSADPRDARGRRPPPGARGRRRRRRSRSRRAPSRGRLRATAVSRRAVERRRPPGDDREQLVAQRVAARRRPGPRTRRSPTTAAGRTGS